jgi:integrase
VPVHSELRAILDATPSPHLTYLISGHGKPYATAKSLGNAMSRWAAEAGLTGCSLHGLRKACCRKLAEAGCTVNQIQAVSGHKTLAEVERYTRDADRTRLAEEVISRTQSYPREDRFYPQERKA